MIPVQCIPELYKVHWVFMQDEQAVRKAYTANIYINCTYET